MEANRTAFAIQVDDDQTHIVIQGTAGWDKPIRLPSAMWPVEGRDPTVFTPGNTVACTDKVIAEIYDTLPFRIGRCYDNAKLLAETLRDAGIPARTFAGWLLFSDTIPTHHAVVVVGEKMVLDPSARDYTKIPPPGPDASPEETRAAFVAWVADLEKQPRSETTCFGQVPPGHIYCMAELAPEKAMALRAKLERAYPKHPAFYRADGKSTTPIQDDLRQKGLR